MLTKTKTNTSKKRTCLIGRSTYREKLEGDKMMGNIGVRKKRRRNRASRAVGRPSVFYRWETQLEDLGVFTLWLGGSMQGKGRLW